MEIIFRPLSSCNDLGFSPSIESDTISVTANPTGLTITPLNIIVSKFTWNKLRVHQAATRLNRFTKVAVLRDLKPKLILVPKTSGQGDVTELMNEILEAAESVESEVINFTHYGYVRNNLPRTEIESIFKKLSALKETSIRVLIWDIDSRYYDEILSMHDKQFPHKQRKNQKNIKGVSETIISAFRSQFRILANALRK